MAQADGSVIIDTKMNNDALEKGFERLKTDAESLGITCEKAGDKIKAAFADYDVSANIQNAVAKLQEAQTKLQTATDYFRDAVAMDDDKSAEAWARKRDAAYTQVENAQRRLTQVIAAEANKQAAAEEKAQEKATKATEREAAKKKKAQEKAYNEATKGARKFANRFSRILSGALIFNALSSGLRQLTSYFGTALKKNSEFASSFAQLKGAFLTAVQPIYEVVAPALIYLMNLLTRVMQVVGRFFSLLTGKSSSQMAENAKNLYDQANATEAAGAAAEKAKKQIMGFDEINRLDDGSSSGGGSSGDIAANFEQAEIPAIELDKLITYTSAALLTLGVILTFSGANIPLGLGLIAIGAIGLAKEIEANWDCMENEVGTVIQKVLNVLAVGALVLGAILTFSGANLPLGIGLMILGAAALATKVAINWNTIKNKLKNPLAKVVALVSTALLALGAILTFSGANIPLGIALIAAGAAGICAVSDVDWDAVLRKIQEAWEKIKSWFKENVQPVFTLSYWKEKLKAIPQSFEDIGTQIQTKLSNTAAKVSEKFENAKTDVEESWETMGEWFGDIGGSIKEKVAQTSEKISEKFSTSSETIKEKYEEATDYISQKFESAKSTVLGAWGSVANWFENNVTKPIKRAFETIKEKITGAFSFDSKIEISADGIVESIKSIVNKMIDGINRTISNIVGKLNSMLSKIKNFKAFGLQPFKSVNTIYPTPQIPRLAQGGVIPANQEFLAILGDQKHGTNVEAPLSTIQEAVSEVMGDMLPAMVAGFEALLEENQRLRATVEGIEVGDSTIGQAANRYNQRMAIIRG